ncbi:protein STAY-GREEN, chloroplastic-like protein [Cinnamomum micranthum f. kanehirae]|uniref:Protein STAY-GREEN, chloroplastic-like protein n=1 Tax=Cinnamomum micranthum f. kanehirae TaxID=337451 RepID=A0A3S3N6W3_9MAGN|nr:protein STAY-GREEN, chloroplastic-like protein [Cinnamomum micranthum f. kanehirae]
MAFVALSPLPTHTKPCFYDRKSSPFHYPSKNRAKRQRSIVPVARLFGRAIFEASKLKVLFLGVDEEKHPGNIPRTYTLTHSDITSKITLVISQTINRAQLRGWYNRLQRDEVVAEWKKVQGKMSLHVHCHISGGHFLLDFIARLRHYIFCKELPVVLKAFVHGDENLFSNYPELEEALVWVYFHSNLQEFNTVECWGPLKDAVAPRPDLMKDQFSSPNNNWERPLPCQADCTCCFPPLSLIPWPQDFEVDNKTS